MSRDLPIKEIASEEVGQQGLLAVSGSFVLVMLPHFLRLPVWISALAGFAVLWRMAQSYSRVPAVPRWLLVPLVVIGGFAVFAQYWTIVGRNPGLALLTVMTSLKFLELKTHRDILILLFLSYFLLATHFLFSQTVYIAVYMLLVMIVTTSALLTINQRDDSVPIKSRLIKASQMIGYSIPIMLILFILVPRIPGPLWGIAKEQNGGVTGLSDTMSPGQISNLITSNEVAFRVNFEGETPIQQDLYWRGPVMVRFDGSTWRRLRSTRRQTVSVPDQVEKIEYTVTLEPHGKHWLFALDRPAINLPETFLTHDLQMISKTPVNELRRYTMQSVSDIRFGLEEPEEYLFTASSYNPQSNPRTYELGSRWAGQYDSDQEVINAALTMFRQQEYVYTLQPPLLGQNASDEFLFETRRGFCEHYASSFALLMRAAGIPSRIVTGYQGGEINEVGNYLIVRQSDAHAWVEVWLENEGWVRIDPTAAVSPDRIESGLEQAIPDEVPIFRIGTRSPLIGQILYNWDSFQHSWNEWVLRYDHRKQASFLRKLGLGIQTWGDMVIAMVISLLTITVGYGLVAWYRERPPGLPEHEKIANRLFRKLKRLGYSRIPSEHVFEFLQRLQREHHFSDPELKEIFDIYNRIKYASGYQRQQILTMFRNKVNAWTPSRLS